MDKYIFDENNGLWYKRQGDYYNPCLLYPPKKKHKSIGLWEQRDFLSAIYLFYKNH